MNKTNNRRTELIIVLAGIAGLARKTIMANIQANLFKMGYVWSNNFWDGKPQHLDAGSLHINSPLWNPTHITYAGDEPVGTDGPAMIYDANTQLDKFYEAAKRALVVEREIEGVKVTITPTEVKMDATALLSRVSTEATAVQRELFG